LTFWRGLERFDTEADDRLDRFPKVAKGYQATTAKMTTYVERERQLASKPNASVNDFHTDDLNGVKGATFDYYLEVRCTEA
jgi:hypothetical protein